LLALLLPDDLRGVDFTDAVMRMLKIFQRAERRQYLEANGYVAG